MRSYSNSYQCNTYFDFDFLDFGHSSIVSSCDSFLCFFRLVADWFWNLWICRTNRVPVSGLNKVPAVTGSFARVYRKMITRRGRSLLLGNDAWGRHGWCSPACARACMCGVSVRCECKCSSCFCLWCYVSILLCLPLHPCCVNVLVWWIWWWCNKRSCHMNCFIFHSWCLCARNVRNPNLHRLLEACRCMSQCLQSCGNVLCQSSTRYS